MSGDAAPLPKAKHVADALPGHLSFPAHARTGAQEAGTGHFLSGGFVADFATADGQRVMVAAFTGRQFADLVKPTRLTSTFDFLERLLQADFSDCANLYAHRDIIAALLTAWFARRTVADLAIAFSGTVGLWRPLHDHSSQSGRYNTRTRRLASTTA